MNAPVLTYRLEATEPHALKELAMVRLRHSQVTDEGIELPVGTAGTIVGVWADGAAYEVDFSLGLATVVADHLELVPAPG